MKIGIYNEKGGSGKSTLTVELCVKTGLPILDLDTQASATRWANRRKPEHTLAKKSDAHWIADCPPGINASIAQFLASCDIVIVPVKASLFDLVTLPNTVKFLKANTKSKLAFVCSDIDGRTNDERQLRETLSVYEMPILGTLSHRVIYKRCGLPGKAASEMDARASLEVDQIVNNMKELMA